MQSTNQTTLPALKELTDAHIVEAARAAGEPIWLIERRTAAWQHFVETPPPFWRRTDLTKFKAEGLTPSLGVHATTVHGNADLAAQGIIFTTLAEALRDHEELVKRYFDTIVDPLKH